MSLCPLMGTDQFQLQARIPGEGEVDLSAKGLEAMIATRTRRNDLRVHVGVVGVGLFDERAAGRSLPGRAACSWPATPRTPIRRPAGRG